MNMFRNSFASKMPKMSIEEYKEKMRREIYRISDRGLIIEPCANKFYKVVYEYILERSKFI